MRSTEMFRGGTVLPATPWSVLLGADPCRRWDALVRGYWRPVYRHLQRTWGVRDAEGAKDLTQDFFTDLLERRALDGIDPGRGRLRHFLKACLNNFVRNRLRAEAALKRGGGMRPRSLDVAGDLPERNGAGDDPFTREWRRGILGRAFRRLEEELIAASRTRAFAVFRAHAVEEGTTYRALAERLGLTVSQVDNALRETKARFRELVVEGVRETVSSRAELEEELALLLGGRT